VVSMVEKLVVAGFLQRKCAVGDRRVKCILITAAGTELYKQVEDEADMMRRELWLPSARSC
jgi:DNA-binding MarR family transcriptional regulator